MKSASSASPSPALRLVKGRMSGLSDLRQQFAQQNCSTHLPAFPCPFFAHQWRKQAESNLLHIHHEESVNYNDCALISTCRIATAGHHDHRTLQSSTFPSEEKIVGTSSAMSMENAPDIERSRGKVGGGTCRCSCPYPHVFGHFGDQGEAVQGSLVDAPHLVVHEQTGEQHGQREYLRAVLPSLQAPHTAHFSIG